MVSEVAETANRGNCKIKIVKTKNPPYQNGAVDFSLCEQKKYEGGGYKLHVLSCLPRVFPFFGRKAATEKDDILYQVRLADMI
jgi:hypothetical protein